MLKYLTLISFCSKTYLNGEEVTTMLVGEFPWLTEGLNITRGLMELRLDEDLVGVGSLGGDVSSLIAWLRVSTFSLELFCENQYVRDKT